jgi:hypothetical protein
MVAKAMTKMGLKSGISKQLKPTTIVANSLAATCRDSAEPGIQFTSIKKK